MLLYFDDDDNDDEKTEKTAKTNNANRFWSKTFSAYVIIRAKFGISFIQDIEYIS